MADKEWGGWRLRMWGEFLPLCLDPLQPDDARRALRLCLSFQSVKWECTRSHASDFFWYRWGLKYYFTSVYGPALPCPALHSAEHLALDVGSVGGQAEKPQPHWLRGHGEPWEQLGPALSNTGIEGVCTRRKTAHSWYHFWVLPGNQEE